MTKEKKDKNTRRKAGFWYNNPVEKFCLIMFYNYVLESDVDKSIYIGFIGDLKRRIIEHNQGLNRSTKSKIPWRLIYYEGCLFESDAKRKEMYLKPPRAVDY